MSYILDALKKSDQQRNIGAAPTLQFAQATIPAPRRPTTLYYALLAIVLLCAGIVIGLLRPWQAEQLPAANEPVAHDAPGTTAKQQPPHDIRLQTAIPTEAARQPPAADTRQPIPMSELPAAIRREIPEMTVQLHAYAGKPGERLVSINSIRLREGGYLMSGLKLEQITPDGMIFSYKGYRFTRGIR